MLMGNIQSLDVQIPHEIAQNWGWFLALGILLLVLGVAAVVRSVDRPVNVVMGLRGVQLSLDDLSALGVKRVSVGSSLMRTALGAFLSASSEMRERGTFNFAADAASARDITAIFKSS